MDQWINIKIKWYWMKKITKNHRPLLTIKPPGFPWFSPRVPLGSQLATPRTPAGAEPKRCTREKRRRRRWCTSHRVCVCHSKVLGNWLRFWDPQRAGSHHKNIFNTHTHGKWPHITEYHKFHMNKLQKGGYDHQVINRNLVAQDTVWEQMFVAGPNCWRSSPQFSGDPGMQSCPTCLHMLGVIPGLHCIHNIYIYIYLWVCVCVCGDMVMYIYIYIGVFYWIWFPHVFASHPLRHGGIFIELLHPRSLAHSRQLAWRRHQRGPHLHWQESWPWWPQLLKFLSCWPLWNETGQERQEKQVTSSNAQFPSGKEHK